MQTDAANSMRLLERLPQYLRHEADFSAVVMRRSSRLLAQLLPRVHRAGRRSPHDAGDPSRGPIGPVAVSGRPQEWRL